MKIIKRHIVMKLLNVFLGILILLNESSFAQSTMNNNENVEYSEWVTEKTMRVDYFHTGNAVNEVFALAKILNDGFWPGSKTVFIDKLELGLYFYEVIDKETSTLLYSRGFASIFGEWQTTLDAKNAWGTFL